MKSLNRKGFGLVPVIVVLVLVSLLVVAGLRIKDNKNTADKTSSTATDTSVQASPTVKTSKDVQLSTQELDSIDVDKELDTSELDADIKSVL